MLADWVMRNSSKERGQILRRPPQPGAAPEGDIIFDRIPDVCRESTWVIDAYNPDTGFTFNSSSLPPRLMSTGTTTPGLAYPAALYRSATVSVHRPSRVSSLSP